MKSTALIIVLSSSGFIIMGLVSLLSKKIKTYFKERGVYKDVDRFMYYNGVFNLSIGLIGVVLGILDNILSEKSKYIIVSYIFLILILSIVQNKVFKKYKNI